MAEMKDIIKIAVDAYHGNVEQYSVGQSMELLQKALIEANGGSTTLNYKNIRDGKCSGLFTLIEEVLSRTVVEGLQGDEYFNALVDFRNVAEGDKNIFEVEDSTLFIVSEAADGTQGIRRQRLGGFSEVSIPTSLKVVKIYEELNRVLSGRVDFNHFINKVAESFRQKLHVEAAAGGKAATIIGTKKAIRNLDVTPLGDKAKEDLYNMGYAGKFYGTPVVVAPQRHKVGSTDFVLADDMLTIIAGDDKPIKCVYEGDPIVIMGEPTANGDLTQEYLYGEKYGMGIVLAGGNAGIGRYEIA